MKIFKIIFFVLFAFFLSYFIFKTFIKREIELNKTESIKGKLESIYESKAARRTSISYNIQIENHSEVLKIIPEYANCFRFQEFKNKAAIDQEIELRIDKNEMFLFPNVKSIVSVKVNSKEYLNLDCVNESIGKVKTRIPLILIAGLILILVIKFAEKKLIKKF